MAATRQTRQRAPAVLALLLAAALLGPAAAATQTTIALWTFPNTVVNDVANPILNNTNVFIPGEDGTATNFPSNLNGVADSGALTAGSQISGHHFAATPVADWNIFGGNTGGGNAFATNSWKIGDYWQVKSSTAGYSSVTFGFNLYITGGLDNWIIEGNPGLGAGETTWSQLDTLTGAPSSAWTIKTVPLPAAYTNRLGVGFRIKTTKDGDTTASSVRIDNAQLVGSNTEAAGEADPHFTGFGGHKFFFDGRDDAAFNIFSEPNTQVNAHFGSIGPKHGVDSTIWMTGFGIRYADKLAMQIKLDVDPAGMSLYRDEAASHATKMRVKLPKGRFLSIELNGKNRDELAGSGRLAKGLPAGVSVYFPPATAVNPNDASDGPVAIIRTPTAHISIHYESEDAAHLDVKLQITGELAGDAHGLMGQTLAWMQDGPGAAIKDGVLAAPPAEFEVPGGLLGVEWPHNKFGAKAAKAPGHATRRMLAAFRGLEATSGTEARPQLPH
ncbi:MAG: hypothetical protein J3K34DRAFT_52212 [Monoraphidium minutum]|nr:MAG: hypothetical protein J3K34DRAFT_52212 [Monoraphidium minutum]